MYKDCWIVVIISSTINVSCKLQLSRQYLKALDCFVFFACSGQLHLVIYGTNFSVVRSSLEAIGSGRIFTTGFLED